MLFAADPTLFEHALVHERCDDIGIEIFVEPGDQPPDLRAVRSRASDHPCRIHRLFEIFADRTAVDQRADAVQALGALGPYARKPFEPSFVKERTQFVAKQPGHVKVTMRLLKWWRDQQAWSCALTKPSDFVLELIAIYASQQCGKVTQAQMVANCMSLLSRFDQLRVVW